MLGGDRLKEFKKLIAEKLPQNPAGEGTEYDIYPKGLKEPYRSRRTQCGEDMYGTIGVAREDKTGRMMQFARNFDLFGAPVALFFAMDRQMGYGQWADLGMFMQSIMLSAREEGLHTAPQEAWAIWYKTLGEFLNIPEEMMLFCGMGLGYMNEEALKRTIATGEAHYWSRSRQVLWHKGASSGLVQKIIEMRIDDDQDAVWVRVEVAGNGASCHVGYRSCFYRKVPVGKASAISLEFTEHEKRFDPLEVYGEVPNPTQL